MANNPTMRGRDMINAKYGTVLFEIEGKRYVAFNIVNFKATVSNDIKALPVLDRHLSVHMETGGEGKFEGEAYGAQPYFRQLLKEKKETLKSTYFTIQVDEHDPGYEGGKSTTIYTDCLIDAMTLSLLDSDNTERREPCSGTFDDFMDAQQYSVLQAHVR